MNDEKRRVTDNSSHNRATDKVWNEKAELSSHDMVYEIYKSNKELESRFKELDERVSVHMLNEDSERKELTEKLSGMSTSIADSIALVKPIFESMPRDAQGVPSPFLHRVQHETQSALWRSGFFHETLKMLFYALIIVASTGNLGNMFAWLLGH